MQTSSITMLFFSPHRKIFLPSSTVVDVFSAWCGPCKAVLSLFRRIKNELGDDLLRFATAKSDNINSLEQYRERSEPTFLFFAVCVCICVCAYVCA